MMRTNIFSESEGFVPSLIPRPQGHSQRFGREIESRTLIVRFKGACLTIRRFPNNYFGRPTES